ncbi:tyrosine-protein phosphatase [Rhizobium sp. SL42]|uniref:tyrosine-protein phosphatase n=1 Tax=Rhizobium sp. SL42 TaxID=2806346 RepID=UPI001F3866B1|nr:tyrosine-protein phosphatase [Rhizobium sp. SL42]UJW73824.1 tyrosine-protein phosphatase [Rhizobium sp. SL42]
MSNVAGVETPIVNANGAGGGRFLVKTLKRCCFFVAAICLIYGAYIGVVLLRGNFHEILPGQYYRSAQLSGETLGRYIDQYKIKTVINLRGEHVGTPWYDAEAAAAASRDTTLVNFPMSALTELKAEDVQRLLGILKTAQQPVLVHCSSGADRTGLASVIFLQQVAGIDEETAEWQLSPVYGHIGLPFLRTYAMDDTWEALEKVIGLDS